MAHGEKKCTKCLLLECRPSDQEVDFLLKLGQRVLIAQDCTRMYSLVRTYVRTDLYTEPQSRLYYV